ncbi:UNVERIFIED_CONTAM: hypothetical protein FKN15_060470 [Acipenser sinensis]
MESEEPWQETEDEDEVEEEKAPDEGFMGMTPLLQAHHAMEKMEEFVHKVWEGRWRVIHHDVLPDWLKDNEYLQHGHRPPMPSFRACFRSIFRIHTETGNIWTHLLGCLFFLCLGIFYMFRPNMSFVAPVQEKVAIGMFFLGAILCLSFSWVFHTVYCHSEGVSRVFSKLDYSGIAFLIMGSFVPWLYYSFYCSPQPCVIYLMVICVFVGLGLSGVVPTFHFMISEGFLRATTMGQMGWLFLMATLYITGACLYAARIPERYFPGKCDIWAKFPSFRPLSFPDLLKTIGIRTPPTLYQFSRILLCGRGYMRGQGALHVVCNWINESVQLQQTIARPMKQSCQFNVGQPVAVRDYRKGQKWINGVILSRTGSRTYQVRRHIDQIRDVGGNPDSEPDVPDLPIQLPTCTPTSAAHPDTSDSSAVTDAQQQQPANSPNQQLPDRRYPERT